MTLRVNQRTEYDCLRTCIASIFQVPYEDVPPFTSDWGPDEEMRGGKSRGWAQECEMNEWLGRRGLGFIRLPNPWLALERGKQGAMLPWGICIAEGKSPRGQWDHAVVADARGCGGMVHALIVHDPHPSRAGLAGDPESFVCFVVDNPALLGRVP